MKPYLASKSPFPLPRQPLSGDISCDVCVIGGGICGVLTAHLLAGHGLHVVLLEAGRLLCGQTSRATAKITAQHGLFARKLIAALATLCEQARCACAIRRR